MMNRSQVLVVGLGQCGGVLADKMKSKNRRYTTVYINSSLGDTELLEFANDEVNTFNYAGADGSGRDREKARIFIENDSARLATFFKRFSQFKTMLVFSSLDGGTGSGSIFTFVQIIKTLYPNMKINVVGVLPKLTEQDLQLKNTLKCCEDLSKISDLINDIKFINNNKRANAEYDEINEEAIDDIDISYGMTGHDTVGSIDENNLENVCTSQGYGVVLKLPKHYEGLKEALTEAIKNSIFSIPPKLDCSYGAINIVKADYNIERVVGLVNADQTIYKTYNDEYNLIALGGCSIPMYDIECIKLELQERDKNKSTTKRNLGFKYSFESDVVEDIKPKEKKKSLNDKDIDALLDFNKFRR